MIVEMIRAKETPRATLSTGVGREHSVDFVFKSLARMPDLMQVILAQKTR
jgi:hypothetical protein